MKLKNILLIVCTQISLTSFAQLKIKDGGHIGIGTNDVSQFKVNINARMFARTSEFVRI
ncbi:MAG: hypothetical protein V4590_09580 [Bacteroidota bacterium]